MSPSRTESSVRFALFALLLPVSLGGCIEYGYETKTVKDHWEQKEIKGVDLLVIIDNSCSMAEEQDNLARSFDVLIDAFDAANTEWAIGVTTTDIEALDKNPYRGKLLGGDDEIIFSLPSPTNPEAQTKRDQVNYDRQWAFEPGVSMQLSPDKYSTTSNVTASNWCPSPLPFYEGEFGTPGTWNPGCDGAPAKPPTPETDDGPRLPVVGDLVITEIMAWSSGVDLECEWFELTNTTDDTLEIGGGQLSDLGNNLVDLPEVLSIAPYQPMVIARSAAGTAACSSETVDVVLGEGFTLNHDVRVIDPSTLNASEIFNEIVAQGTHGTGIELGLEAARLIFEEPQYTEDNQAWLRDEASLAMLFVSDEDDLSPDNVDGYHQSFARLKGDKAFRDPKWLTISAVVGDVPTETSRDFSCVSESGEAYWGRRYIRLANQTGGLVESICEDDFGPIVEALGLTLSELESTFYLSALPKIDSLAVSLLRYPEAEESQDETFIHVRDLVEPDDYVYLSEDNALFFAEDQLPPSGYVVHAQYEPLPRGATNDQGEL